MNGTRIAATVTVLGLFGVAATGLAFAHPASPVLLTVDGRAEQTSTTARTVRALLDSRHVEVGPRDEVDPGLDNVIYARERIEVRHAWHITVRADGATRSRWTTADTVRAALADMGIRIGAYDTVSVPLDRGHRDVVVVVKRGNAKYQTADTTLAKPVTKVQDPSMPRGTTRVIKAGRPGSEQSRIAMVYVDGKLDHVTVLSRKVTVKPVSETVAVGTRQPPPSPSRPAAPGSAAPAAAPSAPSATVSGGMSAAWAKVGYCETGNNPTIVAGQFYGMYMMTLDAWQIAGGHGSPNQASAGEQTMRAQILYNMLGRHPWPVCGKYLP